MIEQAGTELFLFSTTVRTPKAAAIPSGASRPRMEAIAEDAKERFYARNFAEMMGLAA